MKALSSRIGVPNDLAFTVFDVAASGSLVTSRLVSRETLVATCSPASTARSSRSSRSIEVSPENATRMPCMRGLSFSYRPGFGYGQAGRLREGRQLFCAPYEDW